MQLRRFNRRKIKENMADDLGSKAQVDLETVVALVMHIKDPCIPYGKDSKINPRGIYISEAERIMPTIDNPFLKDLLKTTIDAYS